MALTQRMYWKLRPWLTPGLQNSHITYAHVLQVMVGDAKSWLDVGCGHGFVAEWAPFRLDMVRRPRRIVGIDPDARALRAHKGLTWGIVASGESLPFPDASFHLVSTNMVLEHVEHPDRLFAEVFRVLKPGGYFLSHTPSVQGYTTVLTRLSPPSMRVRLARVLQGREAEDVYPTFYRANTPAVLQSLASRSGFGSCTVDHVDSSPLFANFPPLLIPEMLFIRVMKALGVQSIRPCLLATIRKPLERREPSAPPAVQHAAPRSGAA
jgi:ubiquinone/menaquinone biosynthesis C-methylase UbiE